MKSSLSKIDVFRKKLQAKFSKQIEVVPLTHLFLKLLTDARVKGWGACNIKQLGSWKFSVTNQLNVYKNKSKTLTQLKLNSTAEMASEFQALC